VAVAVAVASGGLLSLEAPPTAGGGGLGPLAVGDVIGDMTIVAVHPPHYGAVPIVMRTRAGTAFQVDVLARDPQGPAGVADTAELSLFVANRGDGATATDEGQGLAVMAMAARLHDAGRTPELLTLRERTAQFPGGSYGVPLT